MGNKKGKGPIWHDGRLTAISIGDGRDVMLSVDLNAHWNGGFQVGTAHVQRIQNLDEARAFLGALAPSVAEPIGVQDVLQDGDDVLLVLDQGPQELSFRFRGARLSHF